MTAVANSSETLPVSVLASLRDLYGFGGPPALIAAADLSSAGDAWPHWVVASPSRVAVVAEGPGGGLVRELSLADVEGFRVHPAVGSSFLQAYIDGGWVDLARFSNARGERFREAVERLESLWAAVAEPAGPGSATTTTHCARCGVRLPPGHLSCPRCRPRRAIAARLWGALRPEWPRALAACALTLAGVALELLPPKLQQYLIDEVLPGREGGAGPGAPSLALLAVVLVLASGRVAAGAQGWLKGVLAAEVGAAMTHRLRERLVRKLLELEMAYHDRQQIGALVTRVASDTDVVHSLLHQVTGGFLLQVVQAVAVGAMLFLTDSRLALMTMVPVPLVVAGGFVFWRRVYPNHFRNGEAAGRLSGALTDMIAGMRVVKTYGQEAHELGRYNRASDHLRDCRRALDRASTAYSSAMVVLFSLGGLIVWHAGGREVLAGRMTLGALTAFLAYLALFYAPLATLSQLTTWLTGFLMASQRVFDLLDTPAGVDAPPRPARLPRASGAVVFEDVTFGYEPRRPVLRGLSFAVRPGEMVGIVGRSGSGKTTIANLISRLYDAGAGRVLLDEIDVRDLDAGDLRRAAGVVLQDPFLFRGTVAENLAFGRPDAEPEAVVAAAYAGGAHEFVLRRPLAYDTQLGERGAGLSGGEKQRLCLARALLCDPAVLILDESTSSIDPETEDQVQRALRVLTRGRTTIAISHHLSTLRHADRILVLDDGRLAEEGTHDELVARGGRYARLAEIQCQGHPNGPGVACRRHADARDDEAASPPWLDPHSARIGECLHGTLEVALPDGTAWRGVSAVSGFPATHPDVMISLRASDRHGREREVGIVRRLAEWPAPARDLIVAALRRRYRMPRITAVDSVAVRYGNLEIAVKTDGGPVRLRMRWNENHVQAFGPRGRLITDLEDDGYLIPDLDALSPRDRELLGRYVYW